ncbi:MAG: hypothetical protein H7A23_24225 [Leptospiraceae bacterium]|nr:hypothetical protein [Leptospiraceae bacterium]
MLIIILFFFLMPSTQNFSIDFPISGLFYRILHRKNISHIVIETRPDHYRVTFLVSDRFPYNYKSKSYPLFIKTLSEKDAYQVAKELDEFLQTGYELKIWLNGSQIMNYQFIKSIENSKPAL